MEGRRRPPPLDRVRGGAGTQLGHRPLREGGARQVQVKVKQSYKFAIANYVLLGKSNQLPIATHTFNFKEENQLTVIRTYYVLIPKKWVHVSTFMLLSSNAIKAQFFITYMFLHLNVTGRW